MAGANDFDRISKLNEMSKVLKQHGFAQDALEAIEQANDIYPEYGGKQDDKSTPAPPMAMSKEPASSKESYDQLSTYLKGNEDFKRQTNEQMKKLTDTVNGVVEKMNEIIKTINELESKITAVSKAQSQAAYNARQQAISQEQPQRQQREEPHEESQVTSAPQKEPDRRPAPEPEPHHEGSVRKDGEYANQRTGSYAPGDVSIEKMFYMGKK